jgi:hypothetical protein
MWQRTLVCMCGPLEANNDAVTAKAESSSAGDLGGWSCATLAGSCAVLVMLVSYTGC